MSLSGGQMESSSIGWMPKLFSFLRVAESCYSRSFFSWSISFWFFAVYFLNFKMEDAILVAIRFPLNSSFLFSSFSSSYFFFAVAALSSMLLVLRKARVGPAFWISIIGYYLKSTGSYVTSLWYMNSSYFLSTFVMRDSPPPPTSEYRFCHLKMLI